MSKHKTYLVWDTCDIAEEQIKHLVEDEGMSEHDAREDAYSDTDLYTWAWEDLCDCLTDQMKRINPRDRKWKGEVNNFGWRRQSGAASFDAKDGETLLQKVLPKTDCTFRIDFDFRQHLITINNAHHDAPMGGEMYYLRPMTQKEENN